MIRTDEDLVHSAQSGDDAAFDLLMRRYLKQVFRFAQQYVRTAEDAEDVTQDAFFKAWKHIGKFKPGSSFRPWIFTITRNTALDYLKKRSHIAFSALDSEELDISYAETVEDVAPLQPELFERAETAEELARILESLHPDHRTVFMLHYSEDMTFEEIAVVMSKPMNTVKSWHHRAVERIRSSYAPK